MIEIQNFLQTADVVSDPLLVNKKVMLLVGLDKNQ